MTIKEQFAEFIALAEAKPPDKLALVGTAAKIMSDLSKEETTADPDIFDLLNTDEIRKCAVIGFVTMCLQILAERH